MENKLKAPERNTAIVHVKKDDGTKIKMIPIEDVLLMLKDIEYEMDGLNNYQGLYPENYKPMWNILIYNLLNFQKN